MRGADSSKLASRGLGDPVEPRSVLFAAVAVVVELAAKVTEDVVVIGLL